MCALAEELRALGLRYCDGSAVTQANRVHLLGLLAQQLCALGYRKLHARDLKRGHVTALVRLWQAQELAPGTQKNRMSVLRWWAEKLGCWGVLQADNADDGISSRAAGATSSQAQELDGTTLAAIRDPYVRLSLELQRAFGLRRDEAVKIHPGQAQEHQQLVLKAAWATGGRRRAVPIRTAAQRDVLERATVLAAGGALIPPTRRYREQRQVYESETVRVGLRKLHGLRHAYAQERYEALTGWAAPAAGAVDARAERPRPQSAAGDQRRVGAEAGREYHGLPGALSAPCTRCVET